MLTELHDELREIARDLLGRKPPVTWPALVAAGWTGLEVPADLDGAGATFAETAVVLTELGRAAAGTPCLGTVLATGLLSLLEPGEERDRLLAATASGALRPAVALPGDAASAAPPFAVAAGQVIGRAEFVFDAVEADRLLVPALDADGVPVVVVLGGAAAGLEITGQPVLDETRSLAVVTAEGAEGRVLRFAGDPLDGLRRLSDRAAAALACDALGLSEAMLEATVAYVGTREQFGRPVGSFQAVKHACADMLVRVSVTRRLVGAAVTAIAEDDPGAPVAVAMAKAHACEGAVEVAGTAMQLHGGMGYTWESGVHVHLKRAMLDRSLFGSPADHRARLALRYPR
ncbi:acyl-CoA dehydrogenase family protein [Actinocorallia longicatena]